jgi:Helix-turn-helix domain
MLRIIDPCWPLIDKVESDSNDPIERLYVYKTCEVAAILGCTTRNVLYMCEAGKLKYAIFGVAGKGGRRRFCLAQIRRLIAERAKGRKPRGRNETSAALIEIAKKKLGLA